MCVNSQCNSTFHDGEGWVERRGTRYKSDNIIIITKQNYESRFSGKSKGKLYKPVTVTFYYFLNLNVKGKVTTVHYCSKPFIDLVKKGLAFSPLFVSKTLQIKFMTLSLEVHQEK